MLSVSVFWLVRRTSSKKVIYSQPAARSEVSVLPWDREGLPEGMRGSSPVFTGSGAYQLNKSVQG